MRPLAAIREFLALEAAGGILLAGAAVAAGIAQPCSVTGSPQLSAA